MQPEFLLADTRILPKSADYAIIMHQALQLCNKAAENPSLMSRK